jgi:hypothetical protein
VLKRDPDGVTEDDRRRLNPSCEMLLGEMVNRIRRIDVATAPDAPVIPRAFMGTVSHPPSKLQSSLPTQSLHRIGRRLHLSLRPHFPGLPQPANHAAIKPRHPGPRARRHGVRQVPRVQESGQRGG